MESRQPYAELMRPAGVSSVDAMKRSQSSSNGFLDKLVTQGSHNFHSTMRSFGGQSSSQNQMEVVPVNFNLGTRIMPNKKNDSQLIFSPGLSK